MRVMTFGLLAAGVALTGCADTQLFGGRAQPDETQVVDGPSLVLPPSYDLRPPREGGDYEAILKQQDSQTRRMIMGNDGQVAPAAGNATGTDSWLLQNSGRTDGNIRETLANESVTERAEAQAKAPFWKRWLQDDENEQ